MDPRNRRDFHPDDPTRRLWEEILEHFELKPKKQLRKDQDNNTRSKPSLV